MNIIRLIKIFCLMSLTLLSLSLYSSPEGYPKSYSPEELLQKMLSGEYLSSYNAVKWNGTPGDMHEFNGLLGEKGTLYSFVDTIFIVQRGSDTMYYTVFRTAPMIISEDGDFVNSNNCHVCGVNLGLFSYTIENDSIYIYKFKRNFATHGSFGEKSYDLSMVNLGDGYELLKVDDIYEGMGTTSFITRFYLDGELKLSMISAENNRGSRDKNQNGYYEFTSDFSYDNNDRSIIIKQSGYRIDERRGRKIPIFKIHKTTIDNYSF